MHKRKSLIPSLFEPEDPRERLQITKLLSCGVADKEFIEFLSQNTAYPSISLFSTRDKYIKRYGFKLVDCTFLSSCAKMFKNDRILEVGAGNGFLTHCLQEKGLDVDAVDYAIGERNQYCFSNTYGSLIEADAIEYVKTRAADYSVIVMSWPNYDDSFAFNILKNMLPGQKLLYIGESCGGCTADPAFFELLAEKTLLCKEETSVLNKDNVSWPGIRDSVKLYLLK